MSARVCGQCCAWGASSPSVKPWCSPRLLAYLQLVGVGLALALEVGELGRLGKRHPGLQHGEGSGHRWA